MAARLVPAVLVLWAAGCTSSRGPEYLTIGAGRYQAAFDAAAEAARGEGMAPVLRDRRGGVIETAAADAGSVLEPWKLDAASMGQGVEQTLAHRRRRARFEFSPAAFRPPEPAAEAPAGGPDLFGAADGQPDLTAWEGDLELRVWVYVEQAHAPGLRRDPWSRKLTTRSEIIPPATEEALPSRFWRPVMRDGPYERRLLAAVAKAMGEPGDR